MLDFVFYMRAHIGKKYYIALKYMQNADDIIPFRRSEALYPDVLYGGHEYPGYSGSAWMFRKHGKVKAELRQEEPEMAHCSIGTMKQKAL